MEQVRANTHHYGAVPGVAPTGSARDLVATADSQSADPASQLRCLAQLRVGDLITDGEFVDEKAEILRNIQPFMPIMPRTGDSVWSIHRSAHSLAATVPPRYSVL